MPIRPEMKPLYPDNWNEISNAVKAAAGWRCEHCKNAHGSTYKNNKGKTVKVVITTAHLDHDPTNNAPSNLMALCAACHLRNDAHEHAKNRKRTYLRKRYHKSRELKFKP